MTKSGVTTHVSWDGGAVLNALGKPPALSRSSSRRPRQPRPRAGAGSAPGVINNDGVTCPQCRTKVLAEAIAGLEVLESLEPGTAHPATLQRAIEHCQDTARRYEHGPTP